VPSTGCSAHPEGPATVVDPTYPLELHLTGTYSLEPAEQLLALAADFTRFNDAHIRADLHFHNPATVLTKQTDAAQRLARSARTIVHTLKHQPMYHSPVIRAVFARVRQLAHLATDAADHLIDAAGILNDTREGLPIELGDDFLAVLTRQQALQEAGRRFDLVASLTALGATDALATAETYVVERRHRGSLPAHQPPVLSATQNTVLRAVANGDVAITGGKALLSREDLRISITTIRSLESRGMIWRENCPDWFRDERVHLTAAGRRDLAASFARPRPASPATARPAALRPDSAPAPHLHRLTGQLPDEHAPLEPLRRPTPLPCTTSPVRSPTRFSAPLPATSPSTSPSATRPLPSTTTAPAAAP
jgi:DNA-binding MarR family transcriptional regulator